MSATTPMLPNEHHPGYRCSCVDCLLIFPTVEHPPTAAVADSEKRYTLSDLAVLVCAGDSSSELKRMAVSLAFEMGRNAGITRIDVDLHAELLIVGDPGNGSYEWVIVNRGSIEQFSDCGYGMKSIALRDGLIAFHGLPETST